MDWRSKLPEMVAGRAAAMGETGREWLNRLNGMIAELEKRWNVQVVEVLSGGSHAFVGLVRGSGGEERILKIDMPENPLREFISGVETLRRADGRGYCRLYAVEPEFRAALLEKLGGRLHDSGLEPRRQMRLICEALKSSWQISVEGLEDILTSGTAVWFSDFMPAAYAQLGAPCGKKVLDTALGYVEAIEARTQPGEYVLVHGDAHNNNMLNVPGTDEYRFIDPDGQLYEKAYDVGVLMREWPEEYAEKPMEAARERCRYLSGLTGVAENEIWEWGFLQMAATGMLLIQIGQRELGGKMLGIAEQWC